MWSRPRDQASIAMEFKFIFHDGDLTNRFTLDLQAGRRMSTMRQTEKGELCLVSVSSSLHSMSRTHSLLEVLL